MSRAGRVHLPLMVFPLALLACGGGESTEAGPGPAAALDAPDRTLSLEVEPVYRVGGFEAPDWATFGSVTAARFDERGNLYVLDSQANRITIVAPDGTFLRTIGKSGEGPGELSSPFGFVVLPEGGVAVFDFSHRGFVVYDAGGEHVRTISVDIEEVGIPARDMAYHASGGVVAGIGGRIRMSRNGVVDQGPPTRPVAFYPLTDAEEARVVYEAWDLPEVPDEESQDLRISGSGSVTIRMPAERAFEPELNVAALPGGHLLVADSVGYRLKVVDLDGRVVRTLERPIPPTEVTDAIRRQEKERRLAELEEGQGRRMVVAVRGDGGSGGEVAPDAVRRMEEQRLENMVFAAEIPVVEDVAVEPMGRIWVQRSSGVPGEDGPTDILTADRRYLGTIPPDGLRIPESFGPEGLMVRIETDEFDVPTLVVERLPGVGDSATDR